MKNLIIILTGITLVIVAVLLIRSITNKHIINPAHNKRYTAMKLTSSAFENNQMIPSKYTCDGVNISPPLTISEVPESVKSLVLICDDPDAPAGVFVHWVMYNIPAVDQEFLEYTPKIEKLPDGSSQGINSFGEIGYNGPCPPSGAHRYFFKIYALDNDVTFKSKMTKEYLLKEINGHIITEVELIGLYKRK